MNIMDKEFKDKIIKYWNKSVEISRELNIPAAHFFADRIWCRMVHGTTCSCDYDFFEVYRLSSIERRNLYTEGRFRKTCHWFFNPEMQLAVDSRKGFSANFKAFTKRDIIELPCAEDELLGFAEKHGVIFTKPNNSVGGDGIRKLSHEELLNNKELTKRIAAMDGVAEECIVQHPEMRRLNPTTVSTLRITTLLEKSGKVNIMNCVLRVGGAGSIVDNACAGGVIYHVDKELGIVTGYGKAFNNKEELISPNGVVMPGFQIPCWKEVGEMIVEAAQLFKDARMVGWDVAIGEDGPLLVEANISTGAETLQYGGRSRWNYLKSQR